MLDNGGVQAVSMGLFVHALIECVRILTVCVCVWGGGGGEGECFFLTRYVRSDGILVERNVVCRPDQPDIVVNRYFRRVPEANPPK
jgi:hypothetical protein